MYNRYYLPPFMTFGKMSKNGALNWEDLITANYNFLPIYMLYTNIALNFFDWDLPSDNEQLNADFLERLLFYRGRAAIINDKTRGLLVCDFNNISGWSNMFGYPTKIQAIDIFDHNKIIGEYESDDFVIITNNKMWYPTNVTVLKYSIDLSNIADAFNLNIDSQKFPIILQSGDEKHKLTLEQLTDQIETGRRYIFLKSDLNINGTVTSLEVNAPYLADRLNEAYQKKTAELLTAIGINNQNINKASGITPDEVASNNQLVKLSFNTMLIARQEACDEIKRKFNINTWVDVKDFNTPDLFTYSEKLNITEEGNN